MKHSDSHFFSISGSLVFDLARFDISKIYYSYKRLWRLNPLSQQQHKAKEEENITFANKRISPWTRGVNAAASRSRRRCRSPSRCISAIAPSARNRRVRRLGRRPFSHDSSFLRRRIWTAMRMSIDISISLNQKEMIVLFGWDVKDGLGVSKVLMLTGDQF